MVTSTLSDQVLFYSWIGALFVLLGQSISWSLKEQDKNQNMGPFLLALGLFFFAFAVYARGCIACESEDCTRPPFRPALLMAILGGIVIFVSSLYLGSAPNASNKNQTNRNVAVISFVLGWALVALAISFQNRQQRHKAVFGGIVGVALLLVGQLWLRSQDNKNLVNGPGWIFSTIGVAFLAVSNSLN